METLSEHQLNELVAHMKVAQEHLDAMSVIVFGGKSTKRRAKPTKQDKKEALTLELAKHLGANFLNYR